MTAANNQLPQNGSGTCKPMTGVKRNAKKGRAVDSGAALANAVQGQSFMNFEAIFSGFLAMDIPAEDIKPRENVFTFAAFLALGRCVRKGQHGVKICTFIPASKTDKESGEVKAFRMPRQTTVFHISQTDELPATDATAEAKS